MSKFTVMGQVSKTVTIEVEASSREEALAKAQKRYAEVNIDDLFSNPTLEVHDQSIKWGTAFDEDES